jgi:hypothetical protein
MDCLETMNYALEIHMNETIPSATPDTALEIDNILLTAEAEKEEKNSQHDANRAFRVDKPVLWHGDENTEEEKIPSRNSENSEDNMFVDVIKMDKG